jgi:nicotinate-nucleotide--dimethylbenzimidazole phosphoribosyltransferase
MLYKTINQIEDLDRKAMVEAQKRLDSLIKPPGSLGVLEEMAVRLAGITGKARPRIEGKAVIVMAGDHGVVDSSRRTRRGRLRSR